MNLRPTIASMRQELELLEAFYPEHRGEPVEPDETDIEYLLSPEYTEQVVEEMRENEKRARAARLAARRARGRS